MLAAVEPFNPSTFVGIFGLVAGPLLLVAAGWAALKTQGEARWRSAAEAEKQERERVTDAIRIRDERLRSTNEWAKQVEARYNEKEQLVKALNERVTAQAEHIVARDAHIAQLLERTPEKLWEAVERHSSEAQEQWRLAAESQTHALAELNAKLDAILESVRKIEPG